MAQANNQDRYSEIKKTRSGCAVGGVAENVALQIERRIAYAAMKKAVQWRWISGTYRLIRLRISGRFERARFRVRNCIPRRNAHMAYLAPPDRTTDFAEGHTVYGKIGVKNVWICNKEELRLSKQHRRQALHRHRLRMCTD